MKDTIEQFVADLASSKPVPGGGGASAVCAAVGAGLGHMVGSLTVGKKKYADVEEELRDLMGKSRQLQLRFLSLAEEDGKCFAPLAAAYGMPKETEEQRREKEIVLEKALKDACEVPMEIMKLCCEAISEAEVFAGKGSSLVISDAGAGAAILEGAIKAASLNIYINARMMKDQAYAQELTAQADRMLEEYVMRSGEVFAGVLKRLKGDI